MFDRLFIFFEPFKRNLQFINTHDSGNRGHAARRVHHRFFYPFKDMSCAYFEARNYLRFEGGVQSIS